MEFITLTFDVEPVAKGRPRMTKFGKAYTPAKTRNAEKVIALEAAMEMKKLGKDPYTTPVSVAMEFVMTQPKKPSHPFPSRADIDNYAKLVCDALNEILWEDDSLIVDLYLTKRWGNAGKITVQVMPLSKGQL